MRCPLCESTKSRHIFSAPNVPISVGNLASKPYSTGGGGGDSPGLGFVSVRDAAMFSTLFLMRG